MKKFCNVGFFDFDWNKVFMSLVICPECGRRISSYASICPGCGFPLKLQFNKILENLSHDSDKEARKGVAKNPNCPVNLLEQLSRDSDEGVRWRILKNPNCPVNLLEQLSRDSDGSVRRSVAWHLGRSRSY